MSDFKKNKNKGFTLMEMVAALVILMLIVGLTFGSATAIQQTRVQQCSQMIKLKCDAARELAKTRGSNVELTITKVDDGFVLTVSGNKLLIEETCLQCGRTELFYKNAGIDSKECQLGVVDQSDVAGTLTDTITIVFAGGSGDIIGQQVLDYIIVSNGSKNYQLLFKQDGGLVYYDYESELWESNDTPDAFKTPVGVPRFVQPTDSEGRAILVASGQTIQPEFVYDAQYIKISGIYREKTPSNSPYKIVFELKDPYKTKWEDGTTGNIELEWFIIEP